MTETPNLRGDIRRFSRLRSRSVTVDKAAYMTAVHWQHRGPVVLVYSMPKVASATIHRAITQCTDLKVLHFHNMTRERLAADKEWWRSQSSDRHILWQWRGEYARLRVRLDRRVQKWTIVNGVREPIARSLSGFFHMGERAGYFSRDTPASEVDIERLRSLYIDSAPLVDDWFRMEFQPGTGLDVYARPFPWDEGFAHYDNDRFRCLLLRQEDLARVGADALNEYLGQRQIELPRWNSAEQKFYQELYERFRADVRLPGELVERAYSSAQARHFYAAVELDEFRARWLA